MRATGYHLLSQHRACHERGLGNQQSYKNWLLPGSVLVGGMVQPKCVFLSATKNCDKIDMQPTNMEIGSSMRKLFVKGGFGDLMRDFAGINSQNQRRWYSCQQKKWIWRFHQPIFFRNYGLLSGGSTTLFIDLTGKKTLVGCNLLSNSNNDGRLAECKKFEWMPLHLWLLRWRCCFKRHCFD